MKRLAAAICISLAPFGVLCVAQEAASTTPAQTAPWTSLETASRVPVPSIVEPFLTLPMRCNSQRTIFLRMADSTGVTDLVSISSDGQKVVGYGSAKINDVTRPKEISFFTTDSDVYILVTGSVPEGRTLQLRTPDGALHQQSVYKTNFFLAHFRNDGNYLGAIPLDLPLTPMQFGVFPTGDLLVAGVLSDTHPASTQPRAALVKSNGQFQRFVDLKGDVHLTESELAELKQGNPEALRKHFNEGLATAVGLSTIIAYGRDLLLVRLGQRTPLFSVTPGGEVQAVTPEVPEGYRLHDLKSAVDRWIAVYTRPISDDEGVEFQTYALDPSTGKQIGRYSYPKFLGLGLACIDGSEFSFLTRDQNKLEIVTLLAKPQATQANPK